MPPEVMDAPVETTEISTGSTETVETGAETVETSGTGAETGNEVDSSKENQELTAKPGAKGKINLADVAKTKGDALKAIDPALPAAIRTAAFELGGLYREFPGGLKEAVALKKTLSDYGGAEGLKEVAQANSDYAKLEQQFEKADPAFLTDLADALPSSFSQIMPAGLEKWKQVDPEMYAHVQARVLTQTLDQFKFSDELEKIWSNLDGEKQKPLKDAIASMWQQLDTIRKTGDKAPERKTNPQDEALTKREQQLAERETRALLSPIANEGKRQIQTITDREMTESYKWAETDPSVKEAVSDRVRSEVVGASKKDKGFIREFERLRDRGDSEGLARHVKNFQDRVTPAIVQRVAKLFAVKPKGAGTVATKKPVVTENGTKPVDRGWERVSAQPKFGELNTNAMGRNYEDMIMDKKAILKDGRKVIWA